MTRGIHGQGRTGSSPDRDRRAGKATGNQQAWRSLPANAANARSAIHRNQIQGWPDLAIADSFVAAPAVQRGCGSQQAGANDLGGATTRTSLAPRGVADRALTRLKKQPL